MKRSEFLIQNSENIRKEILVIFVKFGIMEKTKRILIKNGNYKSIVISNERQNYL